MTRPHITFILNPAAGRGKARHIRTRLEDVLRHSSLNYSFLVTSQPGEATMLAREATAHSSVVVAVGGDGTVNEVAAGVMNSSAALAVLSEGSGNDFGRTVGAPTKPIHLIPLLEHHTVKKFDVGKAVVTHKNGKVDERYFFNSIGIGFDAAVAKKVSTIQWLRGVPLYLTALVQTLSGFEPRKGSVTSPEYSLENNFLVVCAGIGQWEGGGFRLTPKAIPDDGLFHVCCAVGNSIREVLPVLPFTLTGKHIGKKHITDFVTDALTVSIDGGFPVHGDGEIFGLDITGVEISTMPGALNVVLKHNV